MFNVGILHRLARFNEIKLLIVVLRSLRHGYRDNLRSIVKAKPPGMTPPGCDTVQHPDNPYRGQIGVNLNRQALTVVVIDYVEGPKTLAAV